MSLRLQLLGPAKRVVVKLGTGLLTDDRHRLSPPAIERLAAQVVALRGQKRQCVLVSSGAIAAGMGVLGLTARPRELPQLQACAAIGQVKLMAVYDQVFGGRGLAVAQVLLTHDDLKHRERHLNARQTLTRLLDQGVVPIINENDTVAVDEIKFGDNDRLGALTATLIDAELLVILSHVAGLLDRDQQVVRIVPALTREIEALAGGTNRVTSVGGMKSKLEAARIVTRAGIPMVIASGDAPEVLTRLVAGEEEGTLFAPHTGRLASRKRWIAFFQHPAGTLVVDDGARQALASGGRSLLAQGIVTTTGRFAKGDVVSLRDEQGTEFARGIARVAHDAVVKDAGVVVHRDDLVVL